MKKDHKSTFLIKIWGLQEENTHLLIIDYFFDPTYVYYKCICLCSLCKYFNWLSWMTHLRQLPMLQFFSHTHFHSWHCSRSFFLGRHYVWRPHDPFLVDLSSFMKSHLPSFFLFASSLLMCFFLHPLFQLW